MLLLCAAPFLGWALLFVPLLVGLGFSIGPLAARAFARPTCPNCLGVVERAPHLRRGGGAGVAKPVRVR